jgi:hypothetical protein
MVFVNVSALLLLLVSLTIFAAPVDDVDLDPELNLDATPTVDAVSSSTAITVISSAQVNAFTPYTYYASAGYCNPSVTKTWACGANCEANPGFKSIASGGDGSSTQYCS